MASNIPVVKTLLSARHNQGLLAREIAKKIGVSENAVYLWEKGQGTTSLFNFICWAEALGFDVRLVDKKSNNIVPVGYEFKRTKGGVSGVAEGLGIDRTTYYRWMKMGFDVTEKAAELAKKRGKK